MINTIDIQRIIDLLFSKEVKGNYNDTETSRVLKRINGCANNYQPQNETQLNRLFNLYCTEESPNCIECPLTDYCMHGKV